jgi:DNA-binding NarL/FixJ family response regulator/signal transduction histidine kinase
VISKVVDSQVGQLLAEGEHAFAAGHWRRLRDIAQQILRLDEGHVGARGYLLAASQMLADEQRGGFDVAGDRGVVADGSAERLEIIESLTRIAASPLSIGDAFESMGELIRHVIPFDVLGLGVHRPADGFVEFPGLVAPAGGPLHPGFRLPYYGSSSGTVMRTGRPLINTDTARRAVSPMQAFVRDHYSIRSSLLMPLHARGRTYGVLSFTSQAPKQYDEEVARRAQEIVEHLAVLVDYMLLCENAGVARIPQERERLAREIHDSLAQSLASVAVQLELAGEELAQAEGPARRVINTARQQALRALEETRRAASGLDLTTSGPGSLERAVRAEAERLSAPLEASIDVVGTDSGLLDARATRALVRIAQEALSNVSRHAEASKARLEVRFGSADVVVSIADDGRGFDTADVTGAAPALGGGFGLASMQERARLVGGRVAIRSAPGLGTQIVATVPVSASPPGAPALFEMVGMTRGKDARGRIRVLIVDAFDVARRVYGEMLARTEGIVVVGEAADAETATRLAGELQPDVVLLDLHLPQVDNVEMVGALRNASPNGRVVLVSVLQNEDELIEGMRAGASGHLAKDAPRDDLARAIRTVHQGASLVPPVIADRLRPSVAGNGAGPERLTAQEMRVLALLESGAPNKAIASELAISVGTVKYHVANIYQKLGVRNRTEAARAARRRGLIRP